ncbi:hypothetical protein MW887_003969 [Aspergillus wentii]|nr:hypothetical protein MW887_003969 [Aspergillus wentii]
MAEKSSFNEEALRHLRLINVDEDEGTRKHLQEELTTAPLFSALVREVIENEYQGDHIVNGKGRKLVYPQYGLLGLRMGSTTSPDTPAVDEDDLVYANVSAPWSAFICGSQGSGMSHTLSCMLENSLIESSPAGKLSSPLAGMVLHYDKFTAFSSTQLCEAAYLCSSNIPVRVLVSPSNYHAMKNAYENLPGLGKSNLLRVVPMYLPQKHLNISMMKTLMGINAGDDQPLYVEVVIKILREMARTSQGQSHLDYNAFKRRLEKEDFLTRQNAPLNMRLEVLESFFEPGTVVGSGGKQKNPAKALSDDLWDFPKGSLTIVDLSCPFIGPDDTCTLFNICVSLFLKGRADAGQIIALDEAHNFLNKTSSDAGELTETLLSIHIAGAATARANKEGETSLDLFGKIVRLGTGEALVFCPTAMLDVTSGLDHIEESSESNRGSSVASTEHQTVTKLGSEHIRLRVRKRITADGGRSQLAE